MGKLTDRVQWKIDDEYNRYMSQVRRLSVSTMLQNIDEIAAMKDVYAYLTQYGELDESETDYILSAEHPLRDLRDQWLYNDKDISDTLNQALWSLCEQEEEMEDSQ